MKKINHKVNISIEADVVFLSEKQEIISHEIVGNFKWNLKTYFYNDNYLSFANLDEELRPFHLTSMSLLVKFDCEYSDVSLEICHCEAIYNFKRLLGQL